MERLVAELTESGALDADQAGWARAHLAERGGTLDTALLELDLVDEATLLSALGARFRMRAAGPEQLAELDPRVAERLPESFSRSFRMCPLRFAENSLIALVQSPLPPEWVHELRETLGVDVEQLVAPAHYLAVGRAALYATALDGLGDRLEERLSRRRAAPDVASVAASMASCRSLSVALDQLLDFARALVEFACVIAVRGGRLQLLGVGAAGSSLALPEPGSSLGPAILHGGYFLGAPASTPADFRFYQELGREVPRRAFVAPVVVTQGGAVVLYADNDSRGIAARWIAELTVLAGRLGHRPQDPEQTAKRRAAEPPVADHAPAASEDVSPEERAVLERLNAHALAAGTSLTAFVDALLASRAPAPAPDRATLELVGEMKGLFERLATDIPAHLARGMALAFRDVVPRIAAAAPAPSSAERPRPAVSLELVENAAERTVETYAARRKKTARVKL